MQAVRAEAMKADLEKYLWDRIPEAGDIGAKRPRETINEMVSFGMIQSPKQAWRTLGKWTDRDLYNYGVCLDLGWKEPAG